MSYLTCDPIEPSEWHRSALDDANGSTVEFCGVVRGGQGDRRVDFLEYEAYGPMVETMFERLVQGAKERWGVQRVLLAHRVGRVEVGEASVLIVVASAHRREAFEACRYLIDSIKHDVPIWKREYFTDGTMEFGRCEHRGLV